MNYWDTQASEYGVLAVDSVEEYEHLTEVQIERISQLVPVVLASDGKSDFPVVEFGKEYSVLDIGCGIGRLMEPLASIFYPVSFYGYEPSREMLSKAPRHLSNVEYFNGDGVTLGPELKHDLIYSVLVFQHLGAATAQSYINQIPALLKEDGRVLIQYVSGRDEVKGEFSHDYSDETMQSWFDQAGLNVDDIQVDDDYDIWSWVYGSKK